MTQQDYKERHIPHRVNLLITYRERFEGLTSEQLNNVRDFNICAKDISALMVRFFLGEMGITLKQGDMDVSEKKAYRFVRRLFVKDVVRDPLYDQIIEVLIFANRAIAHFEEGSVDHNFKTDVDAKRLFKVITYTENMIKRHIYSSDEEFEAAMSLPNNNMHRHLLVLGE